MKVAFEMGHPAHFHNFKNVIYNLEKKGHSCYIFARPKDVLISLLEASGMKYEVFAAYGSGIVFRGIRGFEGVARMTRRISKIKPDVVVSRGSPYSAISSAILRIPHIAFCDTEHALLNNIIAYPLVDMIVTPASFKKELGKKHVRYNGFKELAYLAPEYFTPNREVLVDVGINPDEPYAIIRRVAWTACHDIGIKHGTLNDIEALLKSYMKVYSIEESAKLPIPPEHFHHALAFASLVVSDGATVASEAAILGVPSIYVFPLAGTMGVLEELEERYQVLKTFKTPEDALKALQSILKNIHEIRTIHQSSKKRLVSEKDDVVALMVKILENQINMNGGKS